MKRRILLVLLIILIILIIITILTLINKLSNDHLDSINDNIIYCFWTGNNEMSDNRKKALSDLKENSKCNVMLVDTNNLHKYILKNHPLHEAYKYLHYTHRSDYLRTYFMHFYGGGYSDIKGTPMSWINAFDDMRKHPNAYINGYPEKHPYDVAYGPVTHLYTKLIGNGAYIVRSNTEFTNEWFSEMSSLLDKKLPLLKQMKINPDVAINESSEYPIEWNEMLGRIFHRILEKYIDTGRILYTVPYPVTVNYR
jgi:hypothetical protein